MVIDWTLGAIIAGAMVAGLVWACALLWWGARQCYLLIRKGYRPSISLVIVFGSAISGALLAVLMVLSLIDGKILSNTAENLLIIMAVFVPSVVAPTAVVTVLPRRNRRRTGARTAPFLFSVTAKWLERALWCVAGATIIIGVILLWSSTYYALKLLQIGGFLFLLPAWFTYYRKLASAPALDDAVSTDHRAPVLYLRAFYQESFAFTWGAKKEMARYTYSPATDQAWRTVGVTFEQYLGERFTQQMGPFIALGNPEDTLPPEGAARRYAADDDWQQHFVSLAGAAAAIVMEPSCSDNLRWEITAIRRHSWQCKLFIIMSPMSQSNLSCAHRWVYAAIRAAKRIPAPSWEKFSAEFLHAGFHIDLTAPDPGSVISFDPEGRALVLIRGATRPDEFVAAVQKNLQESGEDVRHC